MKLNEIPGLMIDKRDGGIICAWLKSGRECDIYIDGYNTAIKEQGNSEVEVVVDRELMAKQLQRSFPLNTFGLSYSDLTESQKDFYRQEADDVLQSKQIFTIRCKE